MPLKRDAIFRRRNYYLALATEVAGPVLRAFARMRTGAATDPRSWRRGIILSHSHLGDVLYRTCSLELLHNGLPHCRFAFLTAASPAPLLEGNPHVAEVLPFLDESTGLLQQDAFDALRGRYDVALCSNVIGGGADLWLSLRLGIPNRVAFDFKGLSGFITHPVTPQHPRPYADYFRQMVATITGATSVGELRPRVYPSDADVAAAENALVELGVSRMPFIVCAPGTRQAIGGAPVAHFAGVLRQVAANYAGAVVMIGSRGEDALLHDTAARAGVEPRVLAGTLGVRSIVALMGRADAVLTQDSGPRHLGNAARARVFFFRNLIPRRVETGAYTRTETDLAPDGERLTRDEISRAYRRADPLAAATRVLTALQVASNSEPARRST